MKNRFYIFSLFTLLTFVISCKNAPEVNLNNTDSKSETELNKAVSASDLRYNSSSKKYLVSAHRGGKGYMGYPENCLETIAYLIEEGVNIFEIDLAETADGKLILMHDSKLQRTTTTKGNTDDIIYKNLQKYFLKDDYKKITEFKVSLLKDVLNLAKKEQVILMLDFKKISIL